MRRALRWLPLIALAIPAPLAGQAGAAPMSAQAQIAAATAPLPEQFRADATVLALGAGGRTTELRRGTGAYVCLGDEPGDDRFHVACYHRSLEPLMARGRELRAQGKTAEVETIRAAEAAGGTLKMPPQPAALYSLTGTSSNVDPATGAITGARPLYVVYIPFATAESTGLPTRPEPNAPWLMFPGTYRAHIMFVPRM